MSAQEIRVDKEEKIFTNPPREGTCKKHPSCSSNPKSVTPTQRAREFPNEEWFTVSAKTLFCDACRQEVSLRHSITFSSSRHSKMKG